MIIESITTDSGLCMTLDDQTSHYFGGYFHVKVKAGCDIPLIPAYFEHAAEFSAAVEMLGMSVRFERVLEQMAVSENELEAVRSRLIESFTETTRSYLSSPDFAPRFVRNEYRMSLKSSRMRSFRE